MLRVLIVEDSTAMRAFVRAVLEEGSEPVEVQEASSGFDALRLLPRGAYDLVITDINMPDINGLELLRFVRQGPQHRDTAVLVISTMSSDRDRDRALALGADAFLPKPFSSQALQEAIAKCLELRSGAGGAA
ncbi:MAG: response regulator [Polyangiaceae bacterium]|nr:response regulator [Polyangiaceae bacterium]